MINLHEYYLTSVPYQIISIQSLSGLLYHFHVGEDYLLSIETLHEDVIYSTASILTLSNISNNLSSGLQGGSVTLSTYPTGLHNLTELDGASIEISHWFSGTYWEDRRVFGTGVITDLSFGSTYEPIELNYTLTPTDRGLILTPDTLITSELWADVGDEPEDAEDDETDLTYRRRAYKSSGKYYGIVFGQPSWVEGLCVENDQISGGTLSNFLYVLCESPTLATVSMDTTVFDTPRGKYKTQIPSGGTSTIRTDTSGNEYLGIRWPHEIEWTVGQYNLSTEPTTDDTYGWRIDSGDSLLYFILDFSIQGTVFAVDPQPSLTYKVAKGDRVYESGAGDSGDSLIIVKTPVTLDYTYLELAGPTPAWLHGTAQAVKLEDTYDPSKLPSSSYDETSGDFVTIPLPAEERAIFVKPKDTNSFPPPRLGYRNGKYTMFDLIYFCLSRSTIPYDKKELLRLESTLGPYVAAGHLRTQSSPLDFLRREIYPLLPLAETYGPGGYTLIDLLDITPVLSLNLSLGSSDGSRTSLITPRSDLSDLVNHVSIRYNWSPLEEVYQSSFDSNSPLLGQNNTIPKKVHDSIRTYGLRSQYFESKFLGESSGQAVATQILNRRCTKKYGFTCNLHPRFSFLRPGDVVSVTADDINYESVSMRVRSAEYGTSMLLVDLETL